MCIGYLGHCEICVQHIARDETGIGRREMGRKVRKKSTYREQWDTQNWVKYRVIHKSLRDFRPLRYSSRDGHTEGEHVNRKRDTPIFCPTLQVLDMLTSEGS